MSPRDAETLPQLLAADEFTRNSFGQTNLPKNSSYLNENKEFQGGGGEGIAHPLMVLVDSSQVTTDFLK